MLGFIFDGTFKYTSEIYLPVGQKIEKLKLKLKYHASWVPRVPGMGDLNYRGAPQHYLLKGV